jgi:hypothetical protein
MFKKSIGQTVPISRHTHNIVIAAIAVSGMLLYAIPAAQLASATNLVEPVFVDDETQTQNLAQELVDETRQRIDQQAEQEQEQELCDPLDNIIAPFEPIVGDVC